MVRQTRKPTAPSIKDWQQAISTFQHHRNLDDNKFREGVEQLVAELRSESVSAYDTAARMERLEPSPVFKHDGSAIILKIEKRGLTVEQLALAELELLPLDPDHLPTSAVVVVSPEEIARAPKDLRDRIRIGVDEEKVVHLLRTQAKRLLEGAKRAQRCLDDYKQRLGAIKPATSVAWNALFETTEPWGAPPKEIADRIAIGVRHPQMSEYLSHDDHVALWHDNVRTRLSQWRKRQTERGQPGQKRGPKK